MVYHDFCDISIAVSAPKGLVVPVIRNAESLDFPGIEKEVLRHSRETFLGDLALMSAGWTVELAPTARG